METDPDESELLSSALGLIHASNSELGSSDPSDCGAEATPSGPGDDWCCCCGTCHVKGESTPEDEAGDVLGGVGGVRML